MTKSSAAINGVFVKIFNLGVLLTGKPNSGKSELALTLLDRGHQLIADDYIEFGVDKEQQQLIGSCAPKAQGFLHIRDLGFINIKKMLGKQTITDHIPLQLAINIDNSGLTLDQIEIAQIQIPQLSLSRPDAILVETAVRNFALQQQGYDAEVDFNK
ncbi:MAG: hypothetical protein KAT71_03850 [Gammaproteobacteria bacterium]|nr:hypothetical protein [Gammaproteobacteria bacterium]